MSTSEPPPTEEQLRAEYEAEIKKIRIEHVLLENVVSLINLGMRRTGLAPGTEDERDSGQVRLAIEAIRATMPMIEQAAPEQAGPIRDALSQLQLAYVRIGGVAPGAAAPPGGAPPGGVAPGGAAPPGDGGAGGPTGGEGEPPPAAEPEPVKPGEPGPAQRSGRLWVPGQ